MALRSKVFGPRCQIFLSTRYVALVLQLHHCHSRPSPTYTDQAKPLCSNGHLLKPGYCSCLPGFTGTWCDTGMPLRPLHMTRYDKSALSLARGLFLERCMRRISNIRIRNVELALKAVSFQCDNFFDTGKGCFMYVEYTEHESQTNLKHHLCVCCSQSIKNGNERKNHGWKRC